MLFFEHILGAIQSMITNKLRAGLSMLGIIIGVFAIIVMMALGAGTTQQIVDRFNSMGANLITVAPGGRNTSNVRGGQTTNTNNLITDEMLNFLTNTYGVKNISPIVNKNKQLIYNTYNTNSQILGINPIYSTLKNLTISQGRFISQDDIINNEQVIVLGYQLAQNTFGNEDPIGKEIKLENIIFIVIGTLADNSQANNRAFIPLSTMMSKVASTHYYNSVDIEIEDINKMDFMKTFLENELVRYTNSSSIDTAPFTINSLSEILSSIEQVTATMTMFLAGIAAISLIVGGIGVMNIMLVSVTERTREIGIRKAIGACREDILMQFLVESVIISLIAGVSGVGLSYVTVYFLNTYIKCIITYNSILISFFSVVFIGVVFGILPAYKASNLKPIDALRYE